jgi:Protein of unknown function (DUF2855)
VAGLSPARLAGVVSAGCFTYRGGMTQPHATTAFLVCKNSLEETRLHRTQHAPLAAGQVRLAIESFALTANNITYAKFGDAMNYWQFFPTGEDGWGSIPVWGFARVEESACETMDTGEKLYGYFPMASHVTVEPVRVRAESFFDGAAHRQALPIVYNQLMRCAADPMHAATSGADAERDDVQSLLRPLFITSFLIDDFLADNAFFGAGSADGNGTTLLLSSASSKTAYGTAFQLAQRHGAEVVALTSPRNLSFCESLGCYSRVLAYGQLDQLPYDMPCIYVDFAGSAPLRHAIHSRLVNLAYSCSIGGTRFEARTEPADAHPPGPKATLFFAPSQIKKRSAEWGAKGLESRVLQAWKHFTRRVMQADSPWLRVQHHPGADAIAGAYRNVLAGESDARTGHIVTFQDR